MTYYACAIFHFSYVDVTCNYDLLKRGEFVDFCICPLPQASICLQCRAVIYVYMHVSFVFGSLRMVLACCLHVAFILQYEYSTGRRWYGALSFPLGTAETQNGAQPAGLGARAPLCGLCYVARRDKTVGALAIANAPRQAVSHSPRVQFGRVSLGRETHTGKRAVKLTDKTSL